MRTLKNKKVTKIFHYLKRKPPNMKQTNFTKKYHKHTHTHTKIKYKQKKLKKKQHKLALSNNKPKTKKKQNLTTKIFKITHKTTNPPILSIKKSHHKSKSPSKHLPCILPPPPNQWPNGETPCMEAYKQLYATNNSTCAVGDSSMNRYRKTGSIRYSMGGDVCSGLVELRSGADDRWGNDGFFNDKCSMLIHKNNNNNDNNKYNNINGNISDNIESGKVVTKYEINSFNDNKINKKNSNPHETGIKTSDLETMLRNNDCSVQHPFETLETSDEDDRNDDYISDNMHPLMTSYLGNTPCDIANDKGIDKNIINYNHNHLINSDKVHKEKKNDVFNKDKDVISNKNNTKIVTFKLNTPLTSFTRPKTKSIFRNSLIKNNCERSSEELHLSSLHNNIAHPNQYKTLVLPSIPTPNQQNTFNSFSTLNPSIHQFGSSISPVIYPLCERQFNLSNEQLRCECDKRPEKQTSNHIVANCADKFKVIKKYNMNNNSNKNEKNNNNNNNVNKKCISDKINDKESSIDNIKCPCSCHAHQNGLSIFILFLFFMLFFPKQDLLVSLDISLIIFRNKLNQSLFNDA